MDAYGCEAPQFMDFRKLHEPEDEESIEEYFERGNTEFVSHSQPVAEPEDHQIIEISDDELEGDSEDFQYYTPQQMTEPSIPNKRLSMSMVCLSDMLSYADNDMKKISEDVENLSINQNDKAAQPAERGRSAKLVPRSNKTDTLRRARSNSDNRLQERLRNLSKPKDTKSPYVSMQECVNRFERITPLRFHSKPKGSVCTMEKSSGPKACTIPQSPALATKVRHRPTTAISTAEIEMQQFEEARKFKIKAKPANQKILGPIKPMQLVKKSPTHVQPFNLTEKAKKVPEQPKVVKAEFHARPAPVAPPPAAKPSECSRKPMTCPRTPNVLKHTTNTRKVSIPEVLSEKKPSSKWTNIVTKTMPFSFDRKDQEIRKRLEEQREKIYEEARKAREFRSKPMPAHIYKQPALPVKLNKKAESMESLKALKHEDEPKPFKARPPTSLMKEPFEPKKIERPLIEITQFQLSTEMRMRERHEYDERRRQKELLLEQERLKREEEAKQEELVELQRQRKQTIHVAMPVKKFKDAPLIVPRPVTIPMTPQLGTRYKNKENLALPLDSNEE